MEQFLSYWANQAQSPQPCVYSKHEEFKMQIPGPQPQRLILVVLGLHLEKQYSLQTLSEGPNEAEFFLRQLPR